MYPARPRRGGRWGWWGRREQKSRNARARYRTLPPSLPHPSVSNEHEAAAGCAQTLYITHKRPLKLASRAFRSAVTLMAPGERLWERHLYAEDIRRQDVPSREGGGGEERDRFHGLRPGTYPPGVGSPVRVYALPCISSSPTSLAAFLSRPYRESSPTTHKYIIPCEKSRQKCARGCCRSPSINSVVRKPAAARNGDRKKRNVHDIAVLSLSRLRILE